MKTINPISTFLDTNIFIGAKYDFSANGILALLKEQALLGKVKIYLSNIVVEEVNKHISEDMVCCVNRIRNAQKEVKKILSTEYENEQDFESLLLIPNKKEIKEKVLMNFLNFIEDSNAEVLDNKGVNVDEVISDYFNGSPPFGDTVNKKYEFPDALILSKLKHTFSVDNPACIISNDNRFREAAKAIDGLTPYGSINELLDILNRQSKLYNKSMDFINKKEVKSMMIRMIVDSIDNENIYVDGLDCDRKGYCGGYEYDETIIEDVKIADYELGSIDEISDETISLTISCQSSMSALCTFFDEEDSYWDSEEEEYLFESYGEILEKHEVIFNCSVKLSIIDLDDEPDFEVSDIKFDITLDEHTRKSRDFIPRQNERIEATAEMFDTLEEYHKH